jgi:hydroxymethylglutaryl-CoA lyase
MLPKQVEIVEVGPREGFQFEGISRPEAIAFDDKLALIAALAATGVKTLQIVSFVHPKQVPQMADAERIVEALQPVSGVTYTGIYLNDVGLRRAIANPKLALVPDLVLSASEAFALRNQKRTLDEDAQAARRMGALYRDLGVTVTTGNVMAAFGCNYEGPIPLTRVLERIGTLSDIAEETGGRLSILNLADTMGWADPTLIRHTVAAVRERWPATRIGLHLHDTRGLGLANVYAALVDGVDRFECAVGGLGGCPFAGHAGAAGNVATEEVVFLCDRLGVSTGIDLARLLDAGRLAERAVGHPLPSRLLRSGVEIGLQKAVQESERLRSSSL